MPEGGNAEKAAKTRDRDDSDVVLQVGRIRLTAAEMERFDAFRARLGGTASMVEAARRLVVYALKELIDDTHLKAFRQLRGRK